MSRLSFRMRVLLSFWGLLLVALVVPFFAYISAIERDVLEETKMRAASTLEQVDWLLQEHPGFADHAALDKWVTELGERMGVRITCIVGGTVIADSQVPYARVALMDDHGARPEVLEALKGEVGISVRFSRTLGRELVYAARKVAAFPSVDSGVLRMAVPVSRIKAHTARIRSQFWWGLVVTVGLTLVLSMLLMRAVAGPLREMVDVAKAIGKGDYGRRMRVYPGREFKPLADAVNGMAEDIARTMAEIEDKRGQLEAVFNGLTEGVIVLDGDGRIEAWNRAMAHLLPEVARHQGKRPLEALMEPGLQKAVDQLINSPAGTTRMVTEVTFSGERHMEIALEPFRDPQGVRKVILVFLDVTESKRLDNVRRDFVANVSHELKTPITSVKGYAETIIDSFPEAPEKLRDFVGVILKNADHMTNMVRDLLSLARLEHEGEEREAVPVSPSMVLRQSLETLFRAAKDKNITLVNNVDADEGDVLAEEEGLKEIFTNLVDNAIKYGPEGSEVVVDCTHEDDFAVFSVTDQGPGIPVKSRQRIFERFYRIGSHTSDKTGSSGLGLAICRNVVRGFGGNIWVDSPSEEIGEVGSVFRFTVRRADTSK